MGLYFSKKMSLWTDCKYTVWEDYVIIYKVRNEYVELYRVVNRYQDITIFLIDNRGYPSQPYK